MNSQTQRRELAAGAELVSPLTDPNPRGIHAFDKAKRQWQKSLSVLAAETLAFNRALLARLTPGIWAPPIVEDYERNGTIYRGLLRHTREQIAALEKFTTVDWRE